MDETAKAKGGRVLLQVLEWVFGLLLLTAVGAVRLSPYTGFDPASGPELVYSLLCRLHRGHRSDSPLPLHPVPCPDQRGRRNQPHGGQPIGKADTGSVRTDPDRGAGETRGTATARQVRIAPTAPVPFQPDLRGPHWVIAYQSNRADIIRAERWNATHRWWGKGTPS